MQAIELEAEITAQHEIHLKLPDNITAHTAKVIVLYEQEKAETTPKKRVFGQYRGKIDIADSFDDNLMMTF